MQVEISSRSDGNKERRQHREELKNLFRPLPNLSTVRGGLELNVTPQFKHSRGSLAVAV